ncbi:unnamed protein product [Penicillium bialowiezense]
MATAPEYDEVYNFVKFPGFERRDTRMLEFPLDSQRCHEHKGHQISIIMFTGEEKCGDKRPSSMELYALATITRDEMRAVDRKRAEMKNQSDEARSDGPTDVDWSDECYFTFPHLVLVMDTFGRCRMLHSYFDGKLYVQFSELLDFGYMIREPPEGQKYFDTIDKEDFLEKFNVLLYWAWPVAQGSTIANVPWICGT